MRRVAAIDIGSNSVRLAVYGIVGSSLISLFDEKATCALGRDLAGTGRLSPDGRQQAIQELMRFGELARDSNIEALYPFATAAVREAGDGMQFVDEIAAKTGLQVEVISGLQEARFSALGVAGGIPGATGIVGDLGGGSLELVHLDNGSVIEQATMPLGALMRPHDVQPDELAAWVSRHLNAVPWLSPAIGGSFYLVGGAWRSFARAHMRYTGYPLSVIQEYAMETGSALNLASLVSMMGPTSAQLLTSVSRRRRDIMPYAATLISQLISAAAPHHVIASSHGLREGIVRQRAGLEAETASDPFLDYCRFSGGTTARIPPDGASIFAWLASLFQGESRQEQRWIEGACWLADLAGRDHPDRRADIALARGLHLPAVALTHEGRAFLGLALHSRYGGAKSEQHHPAIETLLSSEKIECALKLGAVLRLAHAVSPRGESLHRCSLSEREGQLVLSGPSALLNGETVWRRLNSAASAFGLEPCLEPQAKAMQPPVHA